MSQFPYFKELIDAAFIVFNSSTKTFIGLVPLVFLVRILITKMMFRSSVHYGLILRDLLVMYVGFFFFEEIIRFVLNVPEYAENLIGKSEPVELTKFKSSGTFLGLLGFTIDEILGYVSVIAYWIMAFLYFIFMSLMICFGGAVVFFSTMFQMRWMASAFFIIAAMLSMWPFMWYVVDQSVSEILKHIIKSNSDFALFATNLGGNLIKIGVPLVGLGYGLKDPLKITKGVKDSVKSTLNPVGKTKDYAKNKALGAARLVGADTVYRGHVTPRLEGIKDTKKSMKNSALNKSQKIAPLMSYGVGKSLNKLHPRKKKRENAKSSYENFESYNKELARRINTVENKRLIENKEPQRSKFIKRQYSPVSRKNNTKNISPEHKAAFEEVRKINDVKVERLGSWVWANDTNGKNKSKLQELGFQYSEEKKLWHLGPKSSKYVRKNNSYEEIKGFYKKRN